MYDYSCVEFTCCDTVDDLVEWDWVGVEVFCLEHELSCEEGACSVAGDCDFCIFIFEEGVGVGDGVAGDYFGAEAISH